MSEPGLEVPYAAHVAVADMRRDIVDYRDIQRIAAPVVAAELRRLADLIGEQPVHDPESRCELIVRTVRARANELDGGGS